MVVGVRATTRMTVPNYWLYTEFMAAIFHGLLHDQAYKVHRAPPLSVSNGYDTLDNDHLVRRDSRHHGQHSITISFRELSLPFGFNNATLSNAWSTQLHEQACMSSGIGSP